MILDHIDTGNLYQKMGVEHMWRAAGDVTAPRSLIAAAINAKGNRVTPATTSHTQTRYIALSVAPLRRGARAEDPPRRATGADWRVTAWRLRHVAVHAAIEFGKLAKHAPPPRRIYLCLFSMT